MRDGIKLRQTETSEETMTDQDFESLLDELHGSGAPRAVVDVGSEARKYHEPEPNQADASAEDAARQSAQAPATPASKEIITDEEFEDLLDELHGNGAPGGAFVPGKKAPADYVELMLDPTMVIAQAADLHERLCSLLDENQAIGIEASEVNIIDTANLQLLFAFLRERAARNHETIIHRPSTAFINAARSLGMLECLALESR